MLWLKNLLRASFACVQYASVGIAPAYRLASRAGRDYRIPVLVYHKVTANRQSASKLTCAVPEAAFQAHLSWLHDWGFRPISVDEYVNCLTTGESFPHKSVLITFDDGYKSVYTRAYPALRRHGFPAVVFVVTGSFGGRFFPRDEQYADQPAELVDELVPMTWQQLNEASDLIGVGGHSVTHPRLGRISSDRVDWEVQECKRQIEARLGRAVTTFAYPDGIRHHGDYDESTRGALIRAGYQAAFNSEIGRNRATDDPFCQRRIEPRWGDSRSLFEAKLLGAYDWVGLAQSMFHRAFRPDPGH